MAELRGEQAREGRERGNGKVRVHADVEGTARDDACYTYMRMK